MRARSALLFSALMVAASAQIASRGWVMGPWTRRADDHPVIRPDASSVFQDPIRKAPVKWEALHTFNPAAVVRDGRIDVPRFS